MLFQSAAFGFLDGSWVSEGLVRVSLAFISVFIVGTVCFCASVYGFDCISSSATHLLQTVVSAMLSDLVVVFFHQSVHVTRLSVNSHGGNTFPCVFSGMDVCVSVCVSVCQCVIVCFSV